MQETTSFYLDQTRPPLEHLYPLCNQSLVQLRLVLQHPWEIWMWMVPNRPNLLTFFYLVARFRGSKFPWTPHSWCRVVHNQLWSLCPTTATKFTVEKKMEGKRQILSYISHINLLQFSAFGGVHESPVYWPYCKAVTVPLPTTKML